MEQGNNNRRKAIFKNKFKKSYGNTQSGSGQGLLQKEALKKRFLKIKEKDDLKTQKRHKYLSQHDVAEEKTCISEQQLRFLPPLARDSNNTPFPDDELTQQCVPKKKFSKLSKAKFEYKKIIHEKETKREEEKRLRKEKDDKWKAKKAESLRRNKMLSKRNSKGQPVMSARMDLLIERVNEMYGKG